MQTRKGGHTPRHIWAPAQLQPLSTQEGALRLPAEPRGRSGFPCSRRQRGQPAAGWAERQRSPREGELRDDPGPQPHTVHTPFMLQKGCRPGCLLPLLPPFGLALRAQVGAGQRSVTGGHLFSVVQSGRVCPVGRQWRHLVEAPGAFSRGADGGPAAPTPMSATRRQVQSHPGLGGGGQVLEEARSLGPHPGSLGGVVTSQGKQPLPRRLFPVDRDTGLHDIKPAPTDPWPSTKHQGSHLWPHTVPQGVQTRWEGPSCCHRLTSVRRGCSYRPMPGPDPAGRSCLGSRGPEWLPLGTSQGLSLNLIPPGPSTPDLLCSVKALLPSDARAFRRNGRTTDTCHPQGRPAGMMAPSR